MSNIKIFSTTSTLEIAEKVVEKLKSFYPDTELGNCKIEKFANEEITCQYNKSVRDKKVYIFGHTGTYEIMELLLMIDAAKRASAAHISVVIPSYGYARQDKKEGIRGPLGAKLVADMLTVVGASSIITIELHSEAIQGFFNIPVNHVNSFFVFEEEITNLIKDNKEDFVVVSPDAGGFVRASRFAKKLGIDVACMNKERDKPGSISKMTMHSDVKGKHVILVDDMVDSAKTLCKGADYLMAEKEAKSVIAVCTHPVLTGNSIELICTTKNLSKIYLSDTLPITHKLYDFKWADVYLQQDNYDLNKIKVITSANILAKIIGRISSGKSINEINS